MPLYDFSKETVADWEIIGKTEPYFGVLTHEKFKNNNLTKDSKAEFFRSGYSQIKSLLAELGLASDTKFDTVLDFGSGVGRLVIPMSKLSNSAIAIEIAESMQKELKKNINEQNVKNLKVFYTIEEYEADSAGKVDWVNSYIVFQHIPPPIGYKILDKLLRLLKHNGYFSLHFNIFSSVQPANSIYQQLNNETLLILGDIEKQPEGSIKMFDYNLNAIFFILLKNGISGFNCTHEDHGVYHTLRLWGQRVSKFSLLSPNFENHMFLNNVTRFATKILDVKGFHYPETWGTWTSEKEAAVSLLLNDQLKNAELTLSMQMQFFNPNSKEKQVKVFVNNNNIGALSFKDSDLRSYVFNLAENIINQSEEFELKFVINEHESAPFKLGLSSDTRNLGLGLVALDIDKSKRL
jgi:SAM-dependent methyltransferase